MSMQSSGDSFIPSIQNTKAIISNGQIYIPIQFPVDPITGEKQNGTITDQTKRVLKNIDLILIDAGCTRDNIIKMTLYITDMSDWGIVNEALAEFFQANKPSKSVVTVKEETFGYKIAFDATAIKLFDI